MKSWASLSCISAAVPVTGKTGSAHQNNRSKVVLVQRAASEGWGGERPGALLARRTRTVKRENVTRADPLLPERAPSEGPRSTAAVGPTRVPFQEREASELGRII